MSRKEVRSCAFKLVYQLKFHKADNIIKNLDMYFENMEINSEKTKEEALEFVHGIFNNLEKIDKTINDCSKGWKTTRMPSVDLAILRIAVYEMLYTDLSIKIVANEAVELAKSYSTTESPSFINGLIAEIYKNL